MPKSIAFIALYAVALCLLMTSCSKLSSEEQTTDNTDSLLETIDKSAPLSTGNLITKTATDENGNLNVNYYDTNGNLVESFVWDEDEKIAHSVMKYSDDNKLLHKENISEDGKNNTVESFKYGADNSVEQKTVSEYTDGKLSKSTIYDKNNNCIGYSLSFYTDRLLTKIERYDAEEKLAEYFLYEYDENGRNAKYSAFSADDVLSRYTTFGYDDNSNLINEKYFDGNNTLLSYYTFEYDAQGNMTVSRSYDGEGNLKSEDIINSQ